MKRLRPGLVMWIIAGILGVFSTAIQPSSSVPEPNGYVGSERCASCHAAIAEIQLKSDHALTMRRVEKIPQLRNLLPIRFSDQENHVDYVLEASKNKSSGYDLVATKDQTSERMHLVWGLGAGRKGITFIGKTAAGEYGQSRVSWYQKIKVLDITTGAEARLPKDVHDALAGWFTPQGRKECLECHLTRQASAPPEMIHDSNLGIHCERCHGPGAAHIEFIAERKGPGPAIQNPGKLGAREQLQFCGVCHRQPVEEFSKVILDKATVRFPAQRLVLSRCYDESDGKLKCTTCHDPHESLPESRAAYDPKCLSCHASRASIGSPCPVSKKDCVSCHMPVEPLMKHSEFADHWIRKVRATR
jgi:Cytochrome c554 and c-prime